MRTTCRLILGIAVFVAAAGVASAQQPDFQPPPSPVPETQVTPAPPAPDTAPPTEQTFQKLELVPIPAAPALATTAKPAEKVSRLTAKKPARATASKKPIEKPATPESSSPASEAAVAASVAVSADSSLPPSPGAPATADVPAGAASQGLSPKAPPAVDPVVQAEIDKKLTDAAQRKKAVGGRVLLGFGALALIGLAIYFVRSRKNTNAMPPIFESGVTGAAVATVAPVRSGSAPFRRNR